MQKILFVFTLLISSISLTAPKSSITPNISPQKAYELLLKNEASLIDVRDWDEVMWGIAKSAHWIPAHEITAKTPRYAAMAKKLSQKNLIIVYCASGKRAQNAIIQLRKDGFRTANMGTYFSWLEAELPIYIPKDLNDAEAQ